VKDFIFCFPKKTRFYFNLLRPAGGLVANVIIAGEDEEDNDGAGFIVEEKLKDDLDLKTIPEKDVRFFPKILDLKSTAKFFD